MTKRSALLAASTIVSAITSHESRAQTQACSAPYYVEQRFPTTGAEQTRWKLCWQVLNGPNLVITGAWFRPAPTSAWIKLIYDARVSQLFVPYHPGSPRYLDIGYGFGSVPLNGGDCPSPIGVLIGRSQETCKEVRDRGIAWKHDALKRRGEELVLWSVMAAANYNYIIEWTFRDDGVVIGRVGATGQIAGTNAHMHGPIWRLDLDLAGACCDGAMLSKHTEAGAGASDSYSTIANESGLLWNPSSYTMLEIGDQVLRNSKGKQSHWALMPAVSGIPNHLEPWTKRTFWVSRYKWSEMLGDMVTTYVASPESTVNQDLVVWYYAGLHHLIRDEDTNMTHVMWVGFMLKPANLWSQTPLYP